MSTWFRKPNPDVVNSLDYLFWVKESYAILFANTKEHFKSGEY